MCEDAHVRICVFVSTCMCVRVCVRVCVRLRVRAHACAHEAAHVYACVMSCRARVVALAGSPTCGCACMRARIGLL